MGRMPVASGSSVPACPAFCAEKMRRTAPTACVEVMPAGLSSTSQPCTGLPFLRRAMTEASFLGCGVQQGAARMHRLAWVTGSIGATRRSPHCTLAGCYASGLLEVLGHLRRAEYVVDSLGLVERLVGEEADLGGELEIDGVGDLAADELAVPVER